MLKFVILSDLHLVDEGKQSHGLDTFWRLEHGIEAINAREFAGGIDLVFVEPQFLLHGFVWPAGMDAIGGQFEVFRDDDVYPIGVDVGGNSRIHVLCDGFEPHPAA